MYAAFINACREAINPTPAPKKPRWNPFRRAKAKIEETLEQRNRRQILSSFKPEEQELIIALYFDRKCPDCGGTSIIPGPQGGLNENIKCANRECGSEFCVGPMEDGTWCGAPFYVSRTLRAVKDSEAFYGFGYGPKHRHILAGGQCGYCNMTYDYNKKKFGFDPEPPSDFIHSSNGPGTHIVD